ncbi:outer membrane protein [Bartonella sp. DGB1]|uniref:outer membrane protein n=1 Tax=Bartonella sp. DGB1 TaxID=3239807 RepID=UPI003524EE6E
MKKIDVIGRINNCILLLFLYLVTISIPHAENVNSSKKVKKNSSGFYVGFSAQKLFVIDGNLPKKNKIDLREVPKGHIIVTQDFPYVGLFTGYQHILADRFLVATEIAFMMNAVIIKAVKQVDIIVNNKKKWEIILNEKSLYQELNANSELNFKFGYLLHNNLLAFTRLGIKATYSEEIFPRKVRNDNMSLRNIYTELLVGAGIDISYATNWTLRLEYVYSNLMSSQQELNKDNTTGSIYSHAINLGMSYRF